jgi:hypothetical protein
VQTSGIGLRRPTHSRGERLNRPDGVGRLPRARPVDELARLRGHVDGLAPQIAQGPREGAEAIHQGRALVDQHKVRPPHDTEPAAHRRRRLEGLRPDLDAEPPRGLDQLVEEVLGVHLGRWYSTGARR